MSSTLLLSLSSPYSTKNKSSWSSLNFTPLFGFHSMFRFFLRASTLTHLWDRIFRTTQNLPRSLAALVPLLPSVIPSSSSSVKDSLLHNSSCSSAMFPHGKNPLSPLTHTLTHPYLNGGHSTSCTEQEHSTASTCSRAREPRLKRS